MASNRHLGRIIALQTLYEYDFRTSLGDDSADLDEILARSLERYDEKVGDKAFVEKLTRGVAKTAKDLDAQLAPVAPEWPLNQIALVDHEILRMAVYELTKMSKITPPKVAINEAVELAKSFGSENSSRFVNGVLGTLWRQMNGEEKNGK
ncbi:transcription antitermination factor NusB [Candidatus Saccharibacteria bacterium]|nr:transcription antitermination factor NusB [Candidatus Saccharibacteria bacterium]